MRLSVAEARAMGISLSDDMTTAKVVRRQRVAPREKGSPVNTRRPQADLGSPEWLLKQILVDQWPDRAVPEFAGAVSGRRFRLDVGFPDVKLAVECDGWAYHGKHKGDFHRDRERDRALLLEGWRVCRFYASEIKADPDQVVQTVGRLLALLETETTAP